MVVLLTTKEVHNWWSMPDGM